MEPTALTIVTGFDARARADVFDSLAVALADKATARSHACGRDLTAYLDETRPRRAIVEASDVFSVVDQVLRGSSGSTRLHGIVTVVDACAAAARLAVGEGIAPTARAAAQVMVADGIALTGFDRVTPSARLDIDLSIREVNPRAIVRDVACSRWLDLVSFDASCPDAIVQRSSVPSGTRRVRGVVSVVREVGAVFERARVCSWLASLMSGALGVVLRFEAVLPIDDGLALVAFGVPPTFSYETVSVATGTSGRVWVVGAHIDAAGLTAQLVDGNH